ncbi:HAD family hydrolase [Pseudomonadota bacterium]
MKPQLLIFDLDGTLVDSRKDLASAVNGMRSRYGLQPLPLEVVTGFVGGGARNLVERALQQSDVDVDEALSLYKRLYNTNLTIHTTTYNGVAVGLKKLSGAGHQLAVLSNKPGDASREILRHFSLHACFRSVIGGGDIEKLKPHPDGIRKLAFETGFGTSRTWMIGDHHTDLSAAKSAGVFSALVEYGFGDSRGMEANARFTSFEQLVAFFTGGE